MSGEEKRCAAVNCTSTTSITHRFPKDYKRCRIWAERAGCLHLLDKGVDVLHASYRLCSEHFHDTSYLLDNKKKLSIYALPEIFPEQPKIDNMVTILECGSGAADFKLGASTEMRPDLLCRVCSCSCSSKELIPVFGDKGMELQLLEKIHVHLPIMVTPEDLLPIAICTSCIWKLKMCHEFVHVCLEADAKLRVVFGVESSSKAVYSDGHSTESQFGVVHDPSSEIKEEPLYNEGTNTLEDLADQQFDNSSCIQDAGQIQSADQLFGFDNYMHDPSSKIKVESLYNEGTKTLEDSADQQFNNSNFIQDAGRIQSADQLFGFDNYMQDTETVVDAADEQLYNQSIDQQDQDNDNTVDTCVPDSSGYLQLSDEAADETCDIDEQKYAPDKQYQYQTSDKDIIQSLCHVDEQSVDSDEPAFMNHTTNLEGNVVVTKCRMIKESPKFEVLVVKMETHTNTKEDSHVDKNLELLKNIESSPDLPVDEKTPEQQQATQDLSVLNSDTEFTDDILNESSLTDLPKRPTPIKKSIQLKYRPRSVRKKIVGSSNSNNISDNIPDNASRNTTPDLTHIHSDQTVHCRKNIFNKDHLASHQTSPPCDKTFNCSECGIMYTSQGLLEKHKKCHCSKSEHILISKENLLSSQNTSLQPVVVLKRLQLFLKNDSKPEHVSNKIHVCPPLLVNTHTDSNSILPLSETGLASLSTSLSEQNKVDEAAKTLDISVVPEQTELKEENTQNNSKFTTEVDKEFEDVDSSKRAKIIESINNIIKRNEEILLETSTRKVEKPVVPSKELIEKVVKPKPKPVMTHIKFEKKVHKFWKCLQCFNVFNTEKALQDHTRLKHPVIHKCKFCDKQFDSTRRFERHMSIHTEEKHYMCEFCGRNFRLKRSLQNHLFLHNAEGKKFQCRQCGKKFETKERYSMHCISHDKALYLCDICGKSMKYFSSLKVHRRKCVDPGPAQQHCCAVCGKTYRDKRAFTGHLRLHTNERPFICTQCGDCFRMRIQLTYHMLRHTNARQHKCPVCGKGFNRRQHMRVHVMIHQRPSRYICDICKCSFAYMRELFTHRTTHTEEEIERAERESEASTKPANYVCQICGKHFTNSFTLKNHLMRHAEEEKQKPLSCEMCGKGFLFASKLKVHQRSHSNDKPFTCEVCGKSFVQKAQLQSHQLVVHTGEKPYQCRYCDKRYPFRQNLINHERIHTGERPFKCSLCSKGFRSQNSLKAHALVHSDQRPFECMHCHKSFKRQDILVNHLRIHTGERPFLCNICGRSFKQNGDCKKHEQTHCKSASIQETASRGKCILLAEDNNMIE